LSSKENHNVLKTLNNFGIFSMVEKIIRKSLNISNKIIFKRENQLKADHARIILIKCI